MEQRQKQNQNNTQQSASFYEGKQFANSSNNQQYQQPQLNIEQIDSSDCSLKLEDSCFDENIKLLITNLNQRNYSNNSINIFKVLDKQILLESDVTIKQIQPLLQTAFQDFEKKEYDSAEVLLDKIFRKLNPLDLQQTAYFVSLSVKSSKSIEGEEIVMLLGFTGAGKSTFIHYLAGSQIKQVVNSDGLIHWETSNPLYDSLKNVISKADAKSETKFVIPIKIRAKDQEGNEQGDDDDEYILCDSPGFHDTDGKETEIANLIGITKNISVSKSIKPIVVISEKQIQDRGQGIKSIANIIKRMVQPSHDFKNVVDKFLFVFSKYTQQDERNQLHNKLKSIRDNLNTDEKRDKEFITVIDCMLQQTRIQTKLPFFDLNIKGYEFLELFIKDRKPIFEPKEIFTCFLTQEAELAMSEQMKLDQGRIQEGLKKQNYSLVYQKMKQLQILKEEIKDFQKLNYQWDQNYKLLEEYIQGEIQYVDKFVSEIINLKEIRSQQIDDFLRRKQKLLKTKILEEVLPQIDILIKKLDKALQNTNIEILENLKKEQITYSQNNLNGYFNKLKVLFEVMQDNTYLEQFQQIVKDMINQKLQNCQNNFRSNNFQGYFDEVQLLINYIESCKCMNVKNLEQQIQRSLDETVKIVQRQKQNILDQIFLKSKDKQEEREKIKNALSSYAQIKLIIESFKKSKLVHETFKDQLYKEYGKYDEQILLEYRKREKRIYEIINKDSNNFQELQQLVKKMGLLIQLSSTLEPEFQTLINSINLRVFRICNKVIQAVKELGCVNNNDDQLDIYAKDLRDDLLLINDFEWIEEYDQEQDFKFQKEKIFKALRNLATIFLQKIEYIGITLDETEDLVKLKEYHEKIKRIREFEDQDEKLKEQVANCGEAIKKKMDIYFVEIKDFINIQQITYWEFDRYYSFIKKCLSVSIYKEENQLLKEGLGRKLIQEISDKGVKLNQAYEDFKEILENNAQQNEEKIKVETYTKQIYEGFQDMQKIEMFENIKSILQEKRMVTYQIEHWLNKIAIFYKNIYEAVDKVRVVQQKWIFILLKLQQLDEFNQKSPNQYNFSSLLTKCKDKNLVNFSNLKNGLEQQLNNNYLPHIIATYKQLKDSADQDKQNEEHQYYLKDFQIQIENEIRKIVNSAQQNIDKLKQIITFSPISSQFREQIENSNLIILLIKKYEDYASYFKDHLDIRQFEPCLIQIKSSIQKIASEGPVKVQQTLQKYNFKESHDQLTFMQKIFAVLETQFEIKSQKEQLTAIQNNFFEELVKRVEAINVDKDIETFDLKYLCNRLEQVQEDNFYFDFSKRLQSIYKRKIEEKIRAAKGMTVNQIEQILKQVHLCLDQVPQEMKSQIEQMIEELKNCFSFEPQMKSFFEEKNIQGLKNIQESLKNSGKYNIFNDQFKKFIQNEATEAFNSIISKTESRNIEKNILYLTKIATQSPKEFQQIPKEKLNSVFDQVYCDSYKQAQEAIQGILNDSAKLKHPFDFYVYCQNSDSLIKAKEKMQKDELKTLKQIENSFIIQSIQEQKQKVIEQMKQGVSKVEANKGDLKHLKIQLPIIKQLQYFDDTFFQKLIEIFNSQQQLVSSTVEKLIQEDITKFKIERQYVYYYENFSMSFQNSFEIKSLEDQLQLNTKQNNLVESLQVKMQKILYVIKETLQTCLQDDILDENISNNVNNVYLNSKFIRQYLPQVSNETDPSTVQQKVKQKIKEKIREPASVSTEDSSALKQTTEYLSKLYKAQTIYIYMENIKNDFDLMINQTLNNYKEQKGSLEKLQIQLRQSKYGDQITKNHPFFKGFQISEANTKLQRLGIDSILSKLRGYFGTSKSTDVDKDQLLLYYQKFQNKYNEFLEKYLTYYDKIDFLDLAKELQKYVNKIEIRDNGIVDQTTLAAVPELLAGIFTCWTCINSKYYFESKTQSYDKPESFLLKPHPAQIVAIFRLLGIGYTTKYSNVQPNTLAQVLTGEGKSVILAALSCFYSLNGFSVFCACYSNQLCVRDYEEFSPLFEKLKIKDLIFYGTFNKACEQILNDRGNIREQIQNFIKFDKIEFKDASVKNKSILFIDEVDVFFSKDFFGNNYDMVASIEDETIQKLLDKIWADKLVSNFSFKQISQTEQYKSCISKFSKWSELIQEQTKIVIDDFKNFNKVLIENYRIQNDKVCYKNQDQYLDNISFGYRTLYTYYLENQNSKISDAGLQQQKMFKINCGSFSYSELPKKFLMIKGVTGTLETLNSSQFELIQKTYELNQYTFLPSAYGDSKFTFNKSNDVKVVNKLEYFNAITDKVTKGIVRNKGNKRAILLFFDTKEILLEYYNNDKFRVLSSNYNIQIMTEDNSNTERSKIIQEATYQGAITLMTRIFCRGIDFKVSDIIVLQNEGILAIQTFFSDDKAEEVQAKGRVARQGEDGSYYMILEFSTLQAFLKSEKENSDVFMKDQCYDILDKNRESNFERDFKSNVEYNQKTSMSYHNQSETFLTLLKKSNQEEVKSYLLKLNQGPKELNYSKTLIALDATGSMSGLITLTKNLIQKTFEQARDILQLKGYDPQCFLVLICFFRSYNSRWDDIFGSSSWENNPDKLRSFLQTINAFGGTGPGESVELGLWWANKQHEESPISQVIILGDQPAHLKDEAESHREYFGQNYWDTTPIKGLDYYEPECRKLKSKNVPAHAFYLNPFAKDTYMKISQITGGESSYLDINSSESSQKLTGIFVEQILKDIGKADGRSDELVIAYKAKYS